jgi:hypothetical protein
MPGGPFRSYEPRENSVRAVLMTTVGGPEVLKVPDPAITGRRALEASQVTGKAVLTVAL